MDLRWLRGRHLFILDFAIIAGSIVGAMLLRFDSWRLAEAALIYFPAALFPLIVRPPIDVAGGLYSRAWRYASIPELVRITTVVLVGTLAGIAFFYFVLVPLGTGGTVTGVGSFPRSFFILEGLLTLIGIGGSRFLIRALTEWQRNRVASLGQEARIPTLVYGAGDVGATVLRTIAQSADGLGMSVVGLLDDDRRKRRQVLRGVRVLGGIGDLAAVARATDARRLLIAVPTASGAVVRRAVEEATALGLETRTVPALDALVSGRASAAAIREVRVDDLLRRESVVIDEEHLRELLAGQTVLVTGAGGSIGSELARQVFDLDPGRLVLLDRAEGPLYDIERELTLRADRDSGTEVRRGRHRAELTSRIANVASLPGMRQTIAEDRPALVLHAAAYKHVPMMEAHPADACVVNLGGTLATLDACVAGGVERFVMVSTDKAVEPISVMGATKRLSELAVAEAAHRSGRPYVAVRFGNVLGSSGSVVPLFQRQLEEGVPLTVTHPEMTRYFMTIPEASRLILQASLFGRPGDIFVLDMGKPVRILDLAHDLARLAGRDPDSVPIEYIGLRPGEKLHEQLFYSSELTEQTPHPKILRARDGAGATSDLRKRLDELVALAKSGDGEAARVALFATLASVDGGAVAAA
jgi:FlaA1/EpsC-like NDP-sugar epimerase